VNLLASKFGANFGADGDRLNHYLDADK